MSGTVRASIDGSVAHLIIDNPARRNAMSLDMYAAVPDAVRAIIESPA
ncbi:MAG: enoyl-CoA hydratase, partial [Actinobacteria bacterium]|nr:enoyl-CoA hydratase [Actinomycetota bacterium]